MAQRSRPFYPCVEGHQVSLGNAGRLPLFCAMLRASAREGSLNQFSHQTNVELELSPKQILAVRANGFTQQINIQMDEDSILTHHAFDVFGGALLHRRRHRIQ